MKQLVLPLVLLASACEREPREAAAAPPAGSAERALGTPAPASKPATVPKPADQAQLDRMILAGYTPHADHLHAPGVDECPVTKGTDVVM